MFNTVYCSNSDMTTGSFNLGPQKSLRLSFTTIDLENNRSELTFATDFCMNVFTKNKISSFLCFAHLYFFL